MKDHQLEAIYKKIANTIMETVPEAWSKIYLYGEVTEGVQKSFFFYYPLESDEPVYSHDIPEFFEMDEDEYDELWLQLLGHLKELWQVFKENVSGTWTNLTLFLDHTGNFKIDFNYEDLSEANDHHRSIIWEHKHLGLKPKSEKDKAFLENYLNTAESEEDY